MRTDRIVHICLYNASGLVTAVPYSNHQTQLPEGLYNFFLNSLKRDYVAVVVRELLFCSVPPPLFFLFNTEGNFKKILSEIL